MPANPDLSRRLRDALADCYPDRGRAELLARDAGLKPGDLDFSGAARVFWQRTLDVAEQKGKVETLLGYAIAEAAGRADLVALRDEYRLWKHPQERALRAPSSSPRQASDQASSSEWNVLIDTGSPDKPLTSKFGPVLGAALLLLALAFIVLQVQRQTQSHSGRATPPVVTGLAPGNAPSVEPAFESLTANPTPQATATATPRRSAATSAPLTATPTDLPPSHTPTPSPTLTWPATSPPSPVPAAVTKPRPTARPTSAPTPPILPAPSLIAPADEERISRPGAIDFRWSWDGPSLRFNEAFEVRIWKEGEPEHLGAKDVLRDLTVPIDLCGVPVVQRGGSGVYYWTVAVVEFGPYTRIGPEAKPRRLTVDAGPCTPDEGPPL